MFLLRLNKVRWISRASVVLAVAVVTAACSSPRAPQEEPETPEEQGGAGTGGTEPSSGGIAGQGGVSGAAGGGGAPSISLEGCNGIPIEQSGVLDVNIQAITVSGAVKANGAPLRDESGSRGQL